MNRALSTVFRLASQSKIPHRKAALLTYICHLELCSIAQARKKEVSLPAVPELAEEAMQPVAQMIPVEAGSNGSKGSA